MERCRRLLGSAGAVFPAAEDATPRAGGYSIRKQGPWDHSVQVSCMSANSALGGGRWGGASEIPAGKWKICFAHCTNLFHFGIFSSHLPFYEDIMLTFLMKTISKGGTF